MKEDEAPESTRADVVLPLISSGVSKQGDWDGIESQENEETVPEELEQELAGKTGTEQKLSEGKCKLKL